MKSIAWRWREAGRADLDPVGLVGAVADQIDAELALGALGRDIDLAGGDVEALGEQLEVMDQRFHRLLHLGALGREHLAVERGDRAFRHVVEALLHDPRRLADLLDPDHEPVVAIALGADRNVELHPVVDLVGLAAADVPGDAGGADHRTGKAPGERVLLGDRRDVDVALLEDAVVGDEADRILEQARQAMCRPSRRCRRAA